MSTRHHRRIVLFGATDRQDAIAIADILRIETLGGILMLAAAAIAMGWANFFPDAYRAVQHFHIGPLSIQHWAADGFLTLFFFLAGMELKRELTAGSLRRPAQALVPIMAAIGGMIAPAMIYLAINHFGVGGHANGWAIPMATDIAFALTVLAVAGSRLPTSLRAFLLTLAIVDDIGAIALIAILFSSGLQWLWLAGAAAIAATWWGLQRGRIDHWAIYVPLFIAMWWCMLQSGVHATIAGVILGMVTRTSPEESNDPIDRWEHGLRPYSAGLVVPFFALMSAGVTLDPEALRLIFGDPAPIGIMAGLVIGKVIGIFGAAWLTAHLTQASLAPDLKWSEVFSVSLLGGVGFTVALLVAELSFANAPHLLDAAKAAVLFGSLIAALLASLSLQRRTRVRHGRASDRDDEQDALPGEH